MDHRDAGRLVLPPIADDAYLFSWKLSSMPREGLEVVEALGFTPKAEIVWVKLSGWCAECSGMGGFTRDGRDVTCPSCAGWRGRLHFGMGRHTRASKEVCIVATRGRPKRLSGSVRDVLMAPVPRDPLTRKIIHSAKPVAFYSIVEELCGGPRLELFARNTRPGWDSIGDALGEELQVRPHPGPPINPPCFTY